MRAHYGVERVQAVEVAGFVVAFVDGHKFLFRLSHRSGGVGVVVHIEWRPVVFIRPFGVHLIRAQALRNLKLGFGQKICNQQYREYKQPDIYQQFSFIAFLIHTKTSLFHSPHHRLRGSIMIVISHALPTLRLSPSSGACTVWSQCRCRRPMPPVRRGTRHRWH